MRLVVFATLCATAAAAGVAHTLDDFVRLRVHHKFNAFEPKFAVASMASSSAPSMSRRRRNCAIDIASTASPRQRCRVDGVTAPSMRRVTVPHEYLRGQLEVFDTVAQVDAAKDNGTLFIFLSHQWLGHHDPDPHGVQLKAMKQSIRTIARDAHVKPSAVRVWLDIASISQLNQPEQRLSIASLPTFASCSPPPCLLIFFINFTSVDFFAYYN